MSDCFEMNGHIIKCEAVDAVSKIHIYQNWAQFEIELRGGKTIEISGSDVEVIVDYHVTVRMVLNKLGGGDEFVHQLAGRKEASTVGA